jgi:hypothetical protein
MKRIIPLLILFAGCSKPKLPQSVIVDNKHIVIDVNPSTLKAMEFCNAQGREYINSEEHDFLDLGMGYHYQIVCGKEKNQ